MIRPQSWSFLCTHILCIYTNINTQVIRLIKPYPGLLSVKECTTSTYMHVQYYDDVSYYNNCNWRRYEANARRLQNRTQTTPWKRETHPKSKPYCTFQCLHACMHAYSRILHMMVWQQTGMEWNCYGPVPYTHVGVAVVSTMVGR